MRLVPIPQPGDQWCYEIRSTDGNPLVTRLLAYLARENFPMLGGTGGSYAKVGPLQAEQARQFELHWRPFVA